MSGYRPGTWLMVKYNVKENFIHERIVLSHCYDRVYIILTPDGDIYDEDYGDTDEDGDYLWVHVKPLSGLPVGAKRNSIIQRFNDPIPTQDELEALYTEARQEAHQMRHSQGIGEPVRDAPPMHQLNGRHTDDDVRADGSLMEPRRATRSNARKSTVPIEPLDDDHEQSGSDNAASRREQRIEDDGKWVMIESRYGMKRGASVALNGTEIIRSNNVGLIDLGDDRWCAIRNLGADDLLIYKGAEADGDARLLGLQVIGNTRVRPHWRDICPSFSQLSFGDWSVQGPRTVLWCCNFLDRRQGGPVDHHRWWTHSNGLSNDMWGVEIHDVAMKCAEYMGTYDGIDLPNVAGVEILFRRAQLSEYVYMMEAPSGGKADDKGKGKGRGRGPQTGLARIGFLDEASIFTGTQGQESDVMVCPELMEYVAKEVERNAGILKQVRKAREERDNLAKV